MTPLSKAKRLRRVARLCLHCIRNVAYARARNRMLLDGPDRQFWVTVDGNFYDICVLEWCKLFTERNGHHHWRQVIGDKTRFFSLVLAKLGMSEREFLELAAHIKGYRDEAVAHLDDWEQRVLPRLDIIKTTTIYLYDYLMQNEEIDGCFAEPSLINPQLYFEQHFQQAIRIFRINVAKSHGNPTL